jgi:hypothetical protein
MPIISASMNLKDKPVKPLLLKTTEEGIKNKHQVSGGNLSSMRSSVSPRSPKAGSAMLHLKEYLRQRLLYN